MLKRYGGWWVGGLQDFSVSPRPLGFGFLGLGPGLDNYRQINELNHQLYYVCYDDK